MKEICGTLQLRPSLLTNLHLEYISSGRPIKSSKQQFIYHFRKLNIFNQLKQDTCFFCSISAGAGMESMVKLQVRKNNNVFVTLERDSLTHNGVDTISRSALINLEGNDVVKVTQQAGSFVYSDGGIQTSFTGLWVAAASETGWPLFFVGRTYGWSDTITLAPLNFDEVELNQAGLFDPSDSKMKVPEDGYYFISFSCGIEDGMPVLVNLRYLFFH